MKFTKTTWIILMVCVLVLAASCLGWVYSQQVDQLKGLNSQLVVKKNNLNRMTLTDLNQQKDQITLQIQQLNEQLASNAARLKSSEDSIEVTNAILELAKNNRIDILEIRSAGLSNEELAGTNLDTLSLDLSVQGNLKDIANFAILLNERFPTSIDTLVQLDRIGPLSSPSQSPELTPEPPGLATNIPPEKDFSGTLSLVIYNYKGN
jgi:hypothetical protein